MVTHITIKLQDRDFVLTLKEAKQLRDDLNEFFGKEFVHVPYPYPSLPAPVCPEPYPYKPWPEIVYTSGLNREFTDR